MTSFAIPEYSFLLTYFILLMVMISRYMLLAGGMYLYFEYRQRKGKIVRIKESTLEPGQNKRDIIWSLLSSAIFALSGTVMIMLWRNGYLQVYHSSKPIEIFYGAAALTLLMFLHDTYFYWSHRLLHWPIFFRRFHLPHHHSRTPTAWTSFSFHPVEALLQAVILPVLLILIPVHWFVLILFLSIMTMLGIFNHLGYELFEGLIKKRGFHHLITASHHQIHHSHMVKNFGLYFTFWDKWMGTEYE